MVLGNFFLADGSMLTRTTSQLLTTLYPRYKLFKSELLDRAKSDEAFMTSNIESLSNYTILHDLVEKDINKSRSALMILKKRTYHGYMFWLKNRGLRLDLRIATKRLDTKMNVDQFIMLYEINSAYSEELDRFILKIEV